MWLYLVVSRVSLAAITDWELLEDTVAYAIMFVTSIRARKPYELLTITCINRH